MQLITVLLIDINLLFSLFLFNVFLFLATFFLFHQELLFIFLLPYCGFFSTSQFVLNNLYSLFSVYLSFLPLLLLPVFLYLSFTLVTYYAVSLVRNLMFKRFFKTAALLTALIFLLFSFLFSFVFSFLNFIFNFLPFHHYTLSFILELPFTTWLHFLVFVYLALIFLVAFLYVSGLILKNKLLTPYFRPIFYFLLGTILVILLPPDPLIHIISFLFILLIFENLIFSYAVAASYSGRVA